MRSTLVFEAGAKVENRFLLASTVMRATKKLHVPSTRTEDTVNRVFSEVANGKTISSPTHVIVPPPVVDTLLVYTTE
jgi:hypothetical protein